MTQATERCPSGKSKQNGNQIVQTNHWRQVSDLGGKHYKLVRAGEGPRLAWTWVVIGGCLDVGWAVGLKYARCFTVLLPSLWTLGCLGLSYYLFIKSMRVLPIGTAYAIYTGIAAAGTAAVGMLLLGEPLQVSRIFFIIVLIMGILGLKLTAGDDGHKQPGTEEESA